MTLPNGIDGISEAIGTLFVSTGPLTGIAGAATWGANPISGMNTLTQESVTEKLKRNQILASSNWNATTEALYEGLRRGNPGDGNVPLITSTLEAMVNKLFGTNFQWPTNTEVIAAIEQVPLMTELIGALQSIYKGLTGQESVTDVLADLNADIEAALNEIQSNTNDFLDNVLIDLGLPTSEASAFAAWLSGSAAGRRITNVSSAVIVNGNQQLLESPNFAGAISIAGNGIWTWNSTIYYIIPGETVDEPGSAQVTANGTTQILTSTPAEDIPLGQPVDYSVHVCTAALTGSGTLLQLVAIPWIGNTAQTPIVLASSSAPTGATTGWTNPPSGSKATVLSGIYTPTVGSGITAVSMQLVLTNAALSGTVYWSAASEELTGGLVNDLVNENAASQQASATYWTSLNTAVTQVLGGNWSGGFTTAENAWQTYQAAQAGVASASYVTLHQLLSMVGINTSNGMMTANNVATVLGQGNLGADVQAILDYIANAFGHTGTGHTLAQVESYFGIIPPANVANVLGQGSLGADVQAILDYIANAFGHTGTGHTLAQIEAYFGIIPPTNVAAALPGGTNLAGDVVASKSTIDTHSININNTWSWLFGTTSPTGATPVQPAKVGNVLGQGSLGADVQAILDYIANAFGHTGTGHTLAQIESYFGIIPPANVANVLGQGNLGADVQAILDYIANAFGHTGTGHTLAQIEAYFGIIPPANVAAALPGGTSLAGDVVASKSTIDTHTININNTWSWLFNTTAPSSASQLQPTVVPGTQGISTITQTVQSTWDSIATQVAHYLGLDAVLGTNNPLSTVQDVLGQHAAQTSQALAQSATNADRLALIQPVISQPVLVGPLPTQIASTTPLNNISGSTLFIGGVGSGGSNLARIAYLTFQQDSKVDSFTIAASIANTLGTPTGFYVNAYSVNTTTGDLTQIYTSGNVISSVPAYVANTVSSLSWWTIAFPSELSFAAGDSIAFEFLVVNASNNYGVAMMASTQSSPPFPGVVPASLGVTRSPATVQPATVSHTALTFNTTAPWVAVNGPGIIYNYPLMRKITSSGTITAPTWARFADVVPLGGGASGGGGIGFPGTAGGTTTVTQGAHTISATGGAGGTNNTSFSATDAMGHGAPTETYTPPGVSGSDSFPGSTDVITKQAGSSPGGGGGGGNNNAGAYGYGGACGHWNATTWSINGGETFTITIGAGGAPPAGQSVGAAAGAAGLAYIVFRAS